MFHREVYVREKFPKAPRVANNADEDADGSAVGFMNSDFIYGTGKIHRIYINTSANICFIRADSARIIPEIEPRDELCIPLPERRRNAPPTPSEGGRRVVLNVFSFHGKYPPRQSSLRGFRIRKLKAGLRRVSVPNLELI